MSSSIAPISVTMVIVAALGGAVALTGDHGAAQGSGAMALASMVVSTSAADATDAGEFQVTASNADKAAENNAETLGIAESNDSRAFGEADLYVRSQQEQNVFAALKMPLKEPLDFVEQPLIDVIQILSETYGVQILIDGPALDEGGISRDVPTTARVRDVSLQSALRILLRAASPELDYMVRDEVLLITSREVAANALETHVYDVSHYGNDPEAGDQLRAVLLATVRPDSWQEAGTGKGSVMVLGSASLVVSQSQAVHQEIHQFFEQLRHGMERHDK